MKYPFEVDYQEILADPDCFVTAVVSSLASEFLVLPKGEGFIDYPQFETGYEALKRPPPISPNCRLGKLPSW